MPVVAFADDGDGEGDSNLINPQQRPDSSFIYDSSIIDLSNADSYYDKQTVQITGEAVGDIIDARDGMVWVTLAEASNSNNASVSVLMTRESASHIDTLGRYGTTGTMLQVRGVFHLACPEDQGLSDVHGDERCRGCERVASCRGVPPRGVCSWCRAHCRRVCSHGTVPLLAGTPALGEVVGRNGCYRVRRQARPRVPLGAS